MNLPTPSVEYGLLSPMLIVFGAAIAGVLVEAFVSRRRRYAVQVPLSLVGLAAAFTAVGVAIGWWMVLIGFVFMMFAAVGFVFEYYRGHFAH